MVYVWAVKRVLSIVSLSALSMDYDVFLESLQLARYGHLAIRPQGRPLTLGAPRVHSTQICIIEGFYIGNRNDGFFGTWTLRGGLGEL